MLAWRTRRRFALAVALLGIAAASLGAPTARAEEPAAAASPSGSDPEVIALLDRTLDLESRAEVRFLEHLGWRFRRDAGVSAVTVREGTPCSQADLAAAQAEGDLEVLLPMNAGAREAQSVGSHLAYLADSAGSRCGYLFHLQPALRRALDKIGTATDRGTYVFPKLIVVDSPWFTFLPPEPEWMLDGDVRRAAQSPARAIEAIYERGGTAECFSGQLVAAFAAQYELYGPEGFDEAFRPQDVVIGTPEALKPTTLGAVMRFDVAYRRGALFLSPEEQSGDAGLALAKLGPTAFAGFTGFVVDATGGEQCKQNVTIVSVSPKAAQAFRDHGGFAYVEERTAVVVEHLRAQTWYSSPSVRKAALAPVDDIFAEPIFAEVQVYCHPFGVVPLAKIVRDEVENHRVRVMFYPYVFGREDAWYQRYRRWWKDRWKRDDECAVPPVADASQAGH